MGIVAVERKLQQVPYLTIPSEPSEAGKAKERQRIGRLLNEERTEYEIKLTQEKAILKRLEKRPKVKIELIVVDKNIHEKTQTWHMVFPNNPRSHELSTALCSKDDWHEISLVATTACRLHHGLEEVKFRLTLKRQITLIPV